MIELKVHRIMKVIEHKFRNTNDNVTMKYKWKRLVVYRQNKTAIVINKHDLEHPIDEIVDAISEAIVCTWMDEVLKDD